MLHCRLNKVAHDRFARFELIGADGSLLGRAQFDLWVPVTPGIAVKWDVPITLDLWSGSYVMQPQMMPEDRIRYQQIGFFPWSITNNGLEVGRLRGVNAEEYKRMSPTDFMGASLFDAEYLCYRVGAGKKGLWQCVYQREADGSEHEIAQVDCPVYVEDWLDCYTLHAVDETALVVACMLTLAYNYKKEEHFMEKPIPGPANRVNHLVKTTSFSLKRKYNKHFIES